MLRLYEAFKKAGLNIDYDEICFEACMSQNLLLEYAGGTPQQALTGQEQRGWYRIETSELPLDATKGALEERPDIVESMLRKRMLAKQCVIQGVIQDRLAQAQHIHQQQHAPALLLPGTAVDIWRKPEKKSADGWHGPAELISIERRAGSGIVQHQEQPLLIPLQHLRRHVLFTFFCNILLTDSQAFENFWTNPQLMRSAAETYCTHNMFNLRDDVEATRDTVLKIMDMVDG